MFVIHSIYIDFLKKIIIQKKKRKFIIMFWKILIYPIAENYSLTFDEHHKEWIEFVENNKITIL